MAELEALKRQIAAVKREIDLLDALPIDVDPGRLFEILAEDRAARLAAMQEVLDTLERLMPPF
jgi:hypothetical protein